jgi:hypothetical protein
VPPEQLAAFTPSRAFLKTFPLLAIGAKQTATDCHLKPAQIALWDVEAYIIRRYRQASRRVRPDSRQVEALTQEARTPWQPRSGRDVAGREQLPRLGQIW